MPITIQGTIASRLFQGIGQVYHEGRMIALLNAQGGTLIEGTEPDIAPTITRMPAILPPDAAIGDIVSLDIGAAEGMPEPVADWDIALDGVSIRDQLDAGVLTFELMQPGQYELTVNWINNAGTVAAETVTLIVDPLPEASGVDYTQAIAYIDAASAFQGSAANVTAITSIGQQGVVLTASGSGNPITHGIDGFTFADGQFVQSANLTGLPTGDGVFAVIDITLTGYGSSNGQLLQGGGARISVMDSGGTMRVQGVEDNSVAVRVGATPYGTRIVLGGRIDDLLDTLGVYDIAGGYSEHPINSTDPDLTRIITGRYVNGTLHRLAIFGRPEGGAWPVTFEEVFADFQAGI